MVDKEFNLSDFINDDSKKYKGRIATIKVKEFIKEEMELLRLLDLHQIDFVTFMRRRNKLIGNKLNGN